MRMVGCTLQHRRIVWEADNKQCQEAFKSEAIPLH